MLAWRLALRRGEWDVDKFLSEIPLSVWEELQVANTLIEDFDDWQRTPSRREKRYSPPKFESTVRVRRRLNGQAY